jgi:DNA-binding transcriptional ArsR family regulator
MAAQTSLHPTLWRTCRVLANRTRLRIFALLASESPQTVSSVALKLELSLPVASQYLRALEARGLCSVRRAGRRVEYRTNVAGAVAGSDLVEPLRSALKGGGVSVESVFRLCTAFTHPRRVEIFRTLTVETRTFQQLQAVTWISSSALLRHLGKLEARGFVACHQGAYSAKSEAHSFAHALARRAGS